MKQKIKTWCHDFNTDQLYHVIVFVGTLLIYGLIGGMLLKLVTYFIRLI